MLDSAFSDVQKTFFEKAALIPGSREPLQNTPRDAFDDFAVVVWRCAKLSLNGTI